VEKTLDEVAEYVGGAVCGDGTVVVTGVAGLDEAGAREISFLANPKYAAKVATSKAAAVLLPPGAERHGRNAVEVKNPYLAFAKLVTLFHVAPGVPLGILPGASVGQGAVFGAGCTVYPGAFVAAGVRAGDRVTIHPGATVYAGAILGDDVTLHAGVSVREGCRIGNRVTVHNGTVIGSDGFGYAFDGRGHFKIPQVGNVVVEDDVEIGANCAIDRGALGPTRIGRGTKIDNLVQIAHNCVIGENCIIVSQVGISGSTRLGDYVTLGGQVGVAGHIEIGTRSMVGAKSGIHNSIPAGSVVSGIPAIPHREWLRAAGAYPKGPETRKKVTELEKRITELEARLGAKNDD